MLVRAYCRCTGGDYFVGEFCPWDGWSSPASFELTRLVRQVQAAGRPLSLEALKEAGASDEVLGRVIVVQFGSEAASFEAITPAGYVVQGEAYGLPELGVEFK